MIKPYFIVFTSISFNLITILQLQTANGLLKNLENMVFKNVCMPDLGCFSTGPPFFDPIHRPVSVAPTDLKDMKTKLWLFTPSNNSGTPIIMNNKYKDSLEKSSFEKGLPIKFLVHGFLSKLGEGNSLFKMAQAILKEGSYNVFIVDWSANNDNPYHQTVANTRVVGAQLAQFIKCLQKEMEVDPKDIHIIGHSLGAHIAGYAGHLIDGLARITGLDPAGPFFYSLIDDVCLDLSDANFVDVIHTDMGTLMVDGLGLTPSLGHLDFYPNGGALQPGCEMFKTKNDTTKDVEGIISLLALGCDHSRAVELFLASIDHSSCKFMAKECKSFESYEKGDCDKNPNMEMGFHAQKDAAKRPKQKYYLETTDTFPYCKSK